eukprot:TRINITY_DN17760_c0_g1_i9.p1 TRINITY_DN17760_c0_g1~~TRINITY_DN17760_c0_g1_i9.p1  ORF type:complete len:1714 (+),score=402.69 TRINITY_DN17760_c0_g1_i9:83-5224(+)
MRYFQSSFFLFFFFFFQAEDGIRDAQESRGLGDVYKRQVSTQSTGTQWPLMITCFEQIRDYDHNEFWISSLPYTCTYVGFMVLSTILEGTIGHFLPSEVMTRYHAQFPDASITGVRVVAAMVLLISCAPFITTLAWCSFLQNKYGCFKFTWVLFVLLTPFEAARRGVIVAWRNGCQPSTTVRLLIGVGYFGYFLFAASIPFVESRSDDLIAAIWATSFSLVPLSLLLYYQIDGFTPNVVAYIFGITEQCHIKAVSAPSYKGWKRRQLFLLLSSWALFLVYSLGALSLDNHQSSVFFVMIPLVMVDFVTVASTSSLPLESNSSRSLPFANVILSRVLCIYCGWNSRGTVAGGWALIPPLMLLVWGASYAISHTGYHFSLSSSWTHTSDQHRLTDLFFERHQAWLYKERQEAMLGGHVVDMLVGELLNGLDKLCCRSTKVQSFTVSMRETVARWLANSQHKGMQLRDTDRALRSQWVESCTLNTRIVCMHQEGQEVPQELFDQLASQGKDTVFMDSIWSHGMIILHSYKHMLYFTTTMLVLGVIELILQSADHIPDVWTAEHTLAFLGSGLQAGRSVWLSIVLVLIIFVLCVLFVEIKSWRLHVYQLDKICREQVVPILTNRLYSKCYMLPVSAAACRSFDQIAKRLTLEEEEETELEQELVWQISEAANDAFQSVDDTLEGARMASMAAVQLLVARIKRMLSQIPPSPDEFSNTEYDTAQEQSVKSLWGPVAVYFELIEAGHDISQFYEARRTAVFPSAMLQYASGISVSQSSALDDKEISSPHEHRSKDERSRISAVRSVLYHLMSLAMKACAITSANQAERYGADGRHQLSAALHGVSYGFNELKSFFNCKINGMDLPPMSLHLARENALKMARFKNVHNNHDVDLKSYALSSREFELGKKQGEVGLLQAEMQMEVLRVAMDPICWPELVKTEYSYALSRVQLTQIYQDYLKHAVARDVALVFAVICAVLGTLLVVAHEVCVSEHFYEAYWVPWNCLWLSMSSDCSPYDDEHTGDAIVTILLFLAVMLVCLIHSGLSMNNWALFSSGATESFRNAYATHRLKAHDIVAAVLILGALLVIATACILAATIPASAPASKRKATAGTIFMIFVTYMTIHLPLEAACNRMRASAFSSMTFVLGIALVSFTDIITRDQGKVSYGMAAFYLYLTLYAGFLHKFAVVNFPDRHQNFLVHYALKFAVAFFLIHLFYLYYQLDLSMGQASAVFEWDSAQAFLFILGFYGCFTIAMIFQHKFFQGSRLETSKKLYLKVIIAAVLFQVTLAVLLCAFMQHDRLNLSSSQVIFLYCTAVFGVLFLFFMSAALVGFSVSWTAATPCPESLLLGQPVYRLGYGEFDTDDERKLQTEGIVADDSHASKILKPFTKPVVFWYCALGCLFAWSVNGQIAPPIEHFMGGTKSEVSYITFCLTLVMVVVGPLYHALGMPLAISGHFGRLTTRADCNLLSAEIAHLCEIGYDRRSAGKMTLDSHLIGTADFYKSLHSAIYLPYKQCTGKRADSFSVADVQTEFDRWFNTEAHEALTESEGIDAILSKVEFTEFFKAVYLNFGIGHFDCRTLQTMHKVSVRELSTSIASCREQAFGGAAAGIDEALESIANQASGFLSAWSLSLEDLEHMNTVLHREALLHEELMRFVVHFTLSLVESLSAAAEVESRANAVLAEDEIRRGGGGGDPGDGGGVCNKEMIRCKSQITTHKSAWF